MWYKATLGDSQKQSRAYCCELQKRDFLGEDTEHDRKCVKVVRNTDMQPLQGHMVFGEGGNYERPSAVQK